LQLEDIMLLDISPASIRPVVGIRIQQVAFELAKVLARKWRDDRGDAIPMHRLFPQMLEATVHFIDERVEPVGSRAKQDLFINPYFDKSVDGGGESRERPVLAPGASAMRSTRMVDFHTGKELHDVAECHLNAAMFDSDWEREAAEILGTHHAVTAWFKNDRLGLAIQYRKDGVARRYTPDFIVEVNDGDYLLIEIKGQIGDAMIKKAAAERWCRAVTNDGRFGIWTYALCLGVEELCPLLDQMAASSRSRPAPVAQLD
jgi:type III restriction enzyme